MVTVRRGGAYPPREVDRSSVAIKIRPERGILPTTEESMSNHLPEMTCDLVR
jgi:hypothetical protein